MQLKSEGGARVCYACSWKAGEDLWSETIQVHAIVSISQGQLTLYIFWEETEPVSTMVAIVYLYFTNHSHLLPVQDKKSR